MARRQHMQNYNTYNNIHFLHHIICISLLLATMNYWIGVNGLQNLTFFYNEEQQLSSGIINCNTTFNACSDLSQIGQYLHSIVPSHNDEVNEFNIQIFLLSNLTKLSSIAMSENVVIQQLSFESYLMEKTMEKKQHILTTDFDFVFGKGLEKLILKSVELSGLNIVLGYPHPVHSLANWIFESCYFEKTTITYSGPVTILESLLVRSFVFGEISVSVHNSRVIQGSSLSSTGRTGTISISENTTLSDSVLTSKGIKLSQSQFTSCNISSASIDFLVENSKLEKCSVMVLVAERSTVKSVTFSQSMLYMLGIGDCLVTDSSFSQGSKLSLVGGNGLVIKGSNFTQNFNALSLEKIRRVFIDSSNFIGNINCVSYRNDYIDTILEIASCLFQDNRSKLGGALYAEFATVIVKLCKFLNNKATNGGAIYLKRSMYLESQSHYSSNEAVVAFDDYDCTIHPETCGNGGVLFSTYQSKTNHFFRSVIENNKAVKGGISYNNCRFEIMERMAGNSASYSGDSIFFGSKIQFPVPYFLANTSLGSSELRMVEWKVIETGKVYTSSAIFNQIDLYPGEVITIEFTLIDHFENRLKTAQVLPTFNTKSNSTLIIREVPYSATKLSLLFSYELYQVETTHFDSIDVNVVFSDRNYSFMFRVMVSNCPFEYGLEGPQTNRVCTFRNYSAIIASAAFGVIFGLLVMGLGVFGSVKISQKLIKLHRKEKTEKRIAKKLIDKKFVFGDDIPLLLINRMKDSHWSNIIIPIEDIEILKRIGEGSNGTVYLASWNGIQVALKSIKSDTMDVSDLDDEFEHEASLLNSLKHPSIVRFYGISISESNKYMVVEYSENGSLESGIQSSKLGIRKFDLRKKIQILKGISSGMDYLHSLKPKSIVHRDLKPGNILLDSTMEPKVCDFGLSKTISNNTGNSMTMNLGTILYMAPELIGSGYSIGNALDVYSFGIIMYELFFEERPFIPNPQTSNIYRFSASTTTTGETTDNNNQLFSIPVRVVKGERPKIPWSCQSEFKIWIEEFVEPFENNSSSSVLIGQICTEWIDLMKQCWDENPNTRPTFKEITQILNSIQMKYK